MKRVLLISVAVAMTALVIAQQTRIELRANLVGAAKGKAVWKTRDSPTQKQAELEVEAERLVPGKRYIVYTARYSFAAVADAFGEIAIARRYTTNLRPNILPGTPIWVKNDIGVTVLTGTFQ